MTAGSGKAPANASVVRMMPTTLVVRVVGPRRPEPTGPSVAADGGTEPGASQLHTHPEAPALRTVGSRSGGGAEHVDLIDGHGVDGGAREQAIAVRQATSASNMWPNAKRSSTVDTSPPPPDGNAGGVDHWPSGGSKTTGSPVAGFRSYDDPSRATSVAANAVSTIPSGAKTRSRSTTSNGAPAARATRTPRMSALWWYVHRAPGWCSSGSVPSLAEPLVGFRGHLGRGRRGADPELVHRLHQRLRERCVEVHAQSGAEGQHVVHGDRAFGGDRLAVDRAERVDEHASIGELREQPVDRIVESEEVLLHQDQRRHRRDGLGDRRDAEEAVGSDRARPRRGSGGRRRRAGRRRRTRPTRPLPRRRRRRRGDRPTRRSSRPGLRRSCSCRYDPRKRAN